MGTIVVTEFVSLDGVFEDPGGSENYEYGGWTFEYDRGDEGNKFKLDELMDAKVQLLGRVTYEGFAAAWPSRDGPFAEKLNSDPKYVVSTTLTDPQWQNTTVIDSDVAERVAKLRDETDGVDPRLRERHAGCDASRGGSCRRVAADGLPDDPRPRPASVPRRDRPAEAEADRVEHRRP